MSCVVWNYLLMCSEFRTFLPECSSDLRDKITWELNVEDEAGEKSISCKLVLQRVLFILPLTPTILRFFAAFLSISR
jgi:hypothetical protein